MARVNFTKKRIDEFCCPLGKSQDFLWDTEVPKLALRVTKNGAKSYVFQYPVKNTKDNKCRLTIGSIRAWSIPEARDEARRLQRLLDTGQDPKEVKQREADAQEIARAAKTSRQMPAREAWNAYLAAPHPRWGETHRRDHVLASQEGGTQAKIGKRETKAGPLASLLRRPLSEITSSVVAEWLTKESKDRPTAAANSYRKLRTFINWCAETQAYRDIVNTNCCSTATVKNVVPGSKTKPNDCLQREQLKPWFAEIRKIENQMFCAYLQCLLLTGARREEMLSLRWDDVNFVWRTMSIKDKVDETGKREIPLTPYVADLLSKLSKNRINEWVFSSAKGRTGRVVGVTKPHNKAIKAAGVPHVSLHGLRRSFTTLAELATVPDAITAQIQGHRPSAIQEKHYKRRPMETVRENHEKLEAWILEQAGIQLDEKVRA
jgi:integrase